MAQKGPSVLPLLLLGGVGFAVYELTKAKPAPPSPGPAPIPPAYTPEIPIFVSPSAPVTPAPTQPEIVLPRFPVDERNLFTSLPSGIREEVQDFYSNSTDPNALRAEADKLTLLAATQPATVAQSFFNAADSLRKKAMQYSFIE